MEETRVCLESIKRHAKFSYKVILLDNGGAEPYSWNFLKEGLCDILISKSVGRGGGFGQTDLFRFCDTEYAFFIQNDQELVCDINQDHIDSMINVLNNGYRCRCIDLNGDQSGRGVWTDRAHFIDVKFFNSLAPFPNGGPGDHHHLRWNENYLQEIFEKNNYKIAHSGVAFADRGKWSVRVNPDGSRWRHRTDTKALYLVQGPIKDRYVYPKFSEKEWEEVLSSQNWPEGKIPEEEILSSFNHWK